MNVIIYTKQTCSYCIRAKQLLSAKKVKYQEIPVDTDPTKREEMEKLSGRRTVPQIFINGKSVGGCDDLYQLEKTGELDTLLTQGN